MLKAADTADSYMNPLNEIDEQIAQLAARGIAMPDGLNIDQKKQFIADMQSKLTNVSDVAKKLQDMGNAQSTALNDMSNMGIQNPINQPTAQARFNLRRFAQDMQMPQEVQPQTNEVQQDVSMTEQNTVQKPKNAAEVRNLLDGFVQDGMANGTDQKQATAQAADKAFAYITENFTNPEDSTTDPLSGAHGKSEQLVRNAVNEYYSTVEESQKDAAASVLARTIFPQTENTDNSVPAHEKSVKVDFSSVVNETNKIIKALAEKESKKASKTVFNLSKTAQHQSIRNVILFDQDQNTKDQFTGQMINDWHLLERNKGFGLRLDNYYTADWEKVWRSTVMDKYDPGYIERRFEVDKNVPVGNSYQMEPGQVRRPYLPEYGLTEARLESARDDMNKERGYSPADKGAVFNWKEAQAKKKEIKQAQLAPMKPMQPLKGPLDAKPLGTVTKCKVCGEALKNQGAGVASTTCPKCGAVNSATNPVVKTAPDPIKLQSQNIDIEKLANFHSGIFFHDGKFVVVAGKQKKKFDTYYEAKEFKQLKAEPSSPAPSVRTPLTPEQVERRREVSQHADGLGIDG